MQINVLEYLERTALRFPQKTAFADDDGALSFSQLQARAQGLGSLLAAELAPRCFFHCMNNHTGRYWFSDFIH